MELRVNNVNHFLKEVNDPHGRHYFVHGITDVLNPSEALSLMFDDEIVSVHLDLMQLQPDDVGNLNISLPLNESTSLFIRGVLQVDALLLTVLIDTPLYPLVKDRMGWLAVSGYEILCS